MAAIEQAEAFFAQGYNCAQSVLAAFGPELGVAQEQCLQLSAAFGGGIARMGETCGAVSGALLALGLACAGTAAEDKPANYALAAEFLARFTARHGALRCKDLLGVDLGTPEGMAAMREQRLHETICRGLVRDAAALVAAMLAEREAPCG